MSAFVELKIAGQPRRVEFDLPAGESRPADLLPAFREFSNAFVAAAEAAATGPISCTKGCGACCRQLVPIRKMEARRLAAYVDSLPEPRRSTIRERFHAAAANLVASGMRVRLDTHDALDQRGRIALKLDYFDLGIPCPFLEEESCGIYSERPLVCREHLVTTPAAWCAHPREGTIYTLPLHHADRAVAKLEAQPGEPDWIPLVDLLDWAEAHPGDTATARDPREMMTVFLKDLAG